jgi:hypothetical protein
MECEADEDRERKVEQADEHAVGIAAQPSARIAEQDMAADRVGHKSRQRGNLRSGRDVGSRVGERPDVPRQALHDQQHADPAARVTPASQQTGRREDHRGCNTQKRPDRRGRLPQRNLAPREHLAIGGDPTVPPEPSLVGPSKVRGGDEPAWGLSSSAASSCRGGRGRGALTAAPAPPN